MTWQPIETAIKSGKVSDVLLKRDEHPRYIVGFWSDLIGGWRETYSHERIDGHITHYRPVPK